MIVKAVHVVPVPCAEYVSAGSPPVMTSEEPGPLMMELGAKHPAEKYKVIPEPQPLPPRKIVNVWLAMGVLGDVNRKQAHAGFTLALTSNSPRARKTNTTASLLVCNTPTSPVR